MKVFITWSGQQSNQIARFLRTWLKGVLQSVEPWMSDEDMDVGEWRKSLNRALKRSELGVACLTADNLSKPWIHYEAGVLSDRMLPYLFNVEKGQLPDTLSGLSCFEADKNGTLQVLNHLNRRTRAPLSKTELEEQFDLWWPKLEKFLLSIEPAKIGAANRAKATPRDDEQIPEWFDRTSYGALESLWHRILEHASGKQDLYVAAIHLHFVKPYLVGQAKHLAGLSSVRRIRIRHMSPRVFADLKARKLIEPPEMLSMLRKNLGELREFYECETAEWPNLPAIHGVLFGDYLHYGKWEVNPKTCRLHGDTGVRFIRRRSHPEEFELVEKLFKYGSWKALPRSRK